MHPESQEHKSCRQITFDKSNSTFVISVHLETCTKIKVSVRPPVFCFEENSKELEIFSQTSIMLWFRNLTPIETGDLYILEIVVMVKTKENFFPVIFTSGQVNHISGTKPMKEFFSRAPFLWPSRRNFPGTVPVPQGLAYSGQLIVGTKRGVL